MKLPKLTSRQQSILLLLYKYRFLDRVQIQTLMGHKDYKRINVWLADLRNNHYVEWIYSTNFPDKSKPGIYYLGLNGIRWLKSHQDHPAEEYFKRYREASRSRNFVDQCLLIADCCIEMERTNASNIGELNEVQFTYSTYSEYADKDNYYSFLTESEHIRPPLCYETTTELTNAVKVRTYFMEVIEPTMPRYRVRKRLKNYLEYLEAGEWQIETNWRGRNPIATFVCPTLTDLIYCKRATKRLLEEKWDEDIRMWFTTSEKLKKHGMTSTIWDEIHAPSENTGGDDDEA